VFFNGERRRVLVYEEKEERDEDWAPEFSEEPFVADAVRSVKGLTFAMDRANAHSANPDTAVHTGKTEDRSSSA
jgi:hypothetical protein